jgi:hypothetical protein
VQVSSAVSHSALPLESVVEGGGGDEWTKALKVQKAGL